MRILVVGGAGYIGSHMVKMLLNAGHNVVTFDNLLNGHRDAVIGGEFVLGDLDDTALLDGLFRSHTFDAVMHFASFIQVGESVKEPAKYYRNNVACTLNLLDAMVTHGVRKLIFSSSAAIFGEPRYTPIDEAHPLEPINPYGRSKLMVEQMLADFDLAYGLKSVCLRYFNAAGADPDGQLGERHCPETHLIPLVLQVASGRRESISVYGDNYATPDGSCIRDYIHVADLCKAHFLALEYLLNRSSSAAYNLGNGRGFSVYEVIDSANRVTGKIINVVQASRRDGDPAVLVADSSLARKVLGWKPIHSDLDVIVGHAWRWEQGRNENGLGHG
jgi:UDP-glucose 4-epimerase